MVSTYDLGRLTTVESITLTQPAAGPSRVGSVGIEWSFDGTNWEVR